MLNSNAKEQYKYIMEILPVVFTLDGRRYRRSHFAMNFCFCLECLNQDHYVEKLETPDCKFELFLAGLKD